ncbi:MAG: hypothetical protein ACRDPE_18355 [Solirubrobacterales bacterium]
MIERLRALIEGPVDPGVARALLASALAVGVGFAIVLALARVDHASRPASSPPARRRDTRRPAPGPLRLPPQDPQDRPGSAAHRRAARELAGHRALQHVPFTGAGASIDLVGAKGGRAVLRIEATSVAAGHRAWKAFLRRYHEPGDAYVPHFGANRTRRES